MTRAAMTALLLCACLQSGAPLYGKVDTEAPTVLSVTPPILILDGGSADAGTFQSLTSGQTITIQFSEAMDPASLRPGILVFDVGGTTAQEIPLDVQADPAPNIITGPNAPPNTDTPFNVRIQAAGNAMFAQGDYLLRLNTLLVDQAGNPIPAQLENFFVVK
jgi:hypothetical protein